MPEREHRGYDIGHPAPDRGVTSGWALAFALGGAPAAWSLQLSAGTGLSGWACLDAAGRAAPVASGWVATVMIAANLLALLGCLAALALSARILRRAHRANDLGGGVMGVAEGRTRFLAVWGLFSSLIFLVATLANSIALVWGKTCPA